MLFGSVVDFGETARERDVLDGFPSSSRDLLRLESARRWECKDSH